MGFRCNKCGSWQTIDIDMSNEVECLNCKIQNGFDLYALDADIDELGFLKVRIFILKSRKTFGKRKEM